MSLRLLAGLIRARSGDIAKAAALLDATVTELSEPSMQSQAFIDIQLGCSRPSWPCSRVTSKAPGAG